MVFWCVMSEAESCSLEAVATVIELMEESGMPPLCAAVALERDAGRPLGAVLSEAIRVRLVCSIQSTSLGCLWLGGLLARWHICHLKLFQC